MANQIHAYCKRHISTVNFDHCTANKDPHSHTCKILYQKLLCGVLAPDEPSNSWICHSNLTSRIEFHLLASTLTTCSHHSSPQCCLNTGLFSVQQNSVTDHNSGYRYYYWLTNMNMCFFFFINSVSMLRVSTS